MLLSAWVGSVRQDRAADTEKEIGDNPTTFALRRNNTDLPEVTGRILLPRRGTQTGGDRGEGSISVRGDAAILFPSGTEMRKGDRLSAAGGAVYLVTFVYPGQVDRVLVAVEVVTK